MNSDPERRQSVRIDRPLHRIAKRGRNQVDYSERDVGECSTVINHTYTNRKIRFGIPVQIGYESDLHRAMQVMKQAATNQPRGLTDPAPKAYLKSFGDNGIDLELGLWISDPEQGQLNLCSDINMEIREKFQEAGIDIPYPQRDIRIKSGDDPHPLAL